MTFLLDRFGEHPQSLGPWLAERGLFHEALSFFSMEAAEERPELFGPWLPVLLHLGPEGNEKRHEERLKKAARLLVDVKEMMPETRRNLFAAVLLQVRGSREGVRKLFRKSFAEAKSLPTEQRRRFLDVLALEALTSGERGFALEVMRKRFADGIGEDAPYEACERYFIATMMNKRTVEGLAIAEQIEACFPAEFAVRNNVAYLKLLLNRDDPPCRLFEPPWLWPGCAPAKQRRPWSRLPKEVL